MLVQRACSAQSLRFVSPSQKASKATSISCPSACCTSSCLLSCRGTAAGHLHCGQSQRSLSPSDHSNLGASTSITVDTDRFRLGLSHLGERSSADRVVLLFVTDERRKRKRQVTDARFNSGAGCLFIDHLELESGNHIHNLKGLHCRQAAQFVFDAYG